MINKTTAKKILGDMPLTAEVYWYLRQGGKPPRTGFNLGDLAEKLPELTSQAASYAQSAKRGKQVLVFAALHYWIVHTTLLCLALAGKGHQVTLAYLPYSEFNEAINRFDLRRQNIYTRSVLRKAEPLMRVVSFLDYIGNTLQLPEELECCIQEVALRDTQYVLQVEEVSLESGLYRFRLERNLGAARAAFYWMQAVQPEVVIIPNGSILEFGAVYQVARNLSIPLVTYEFGEQRHRLWLAQNSEVMRQSTKDLWKARGNHGLSDVETARIQDLFSARQKASLWENFARRWQGVPSTGGEKVRSALGLDERPIVLLATNVIGDSLTLGRQVFSDSMTVWLERTVKYFVSHPEAQLVIRIHPGELITKGPSVADVVTRVVAGGLPENIHLIHAGGQINTYDLVEIADLGLVYTTTVGLEMVMSGVPVVVVGQTHYRSKGFTLDPESWEAYFELLENVLRQSERFLPTEEQVNLAWEYAYRFFFEYPLHFPWHLLHMWDDLQEWPMGRVLSLEGQAEFGRTFEYLTGEPIDWAKYQG